MKKIEEKFGPLIEKMGAYKTPGSPHIGIRRPDSKNTCVNKENTCVNKKDYAIYRLGVGVLLHLVKFSRPDIANAIRELSKKMDKPTPAPYKEIKRVIKYIIDIKDYGLKMCPIPLNEDRKLEVILYSDSDWAGDKEIRKLVTEYCIFL